MTSYLELLRAGKLPNASLYLLVGSDATVHRDIVAKLVRGMVDNPELNYKTVLCGADTPYEELEAFAEEYPMLSRRRLMWLDGVDRLSPRVRTALGAWLPRRNPTTVVVLSAGQAATSKKKPTRKKAAAVESQPLEVLAGEQGVTIVCELRVPKGYRDQTPDERVGWLELELGKRGLTAAADARQAFLARVGNGLAELRNELDKLENYLGQRKAATKLDVESIIAYTPTAQLFLLTGRVQRKDAAGALACWSEALAGGAAPLQVLGYLHAALKETATVPLLQALTDADEQIKSGADAAVEVEMLLVRLCQGRAAHA
ncbi:MAG: DNA polymerase III subunit delta [Candidatus Xenobia bacterium]